MILGFSRLSALKPNLLTNPSNNSLEYGNFIKQAILDGTAKQCHQESPSPLGALRSAIAEAINDNFLPVSREIFNKISLEMCHPKYEAHFTSAIALTLAGSLKLDALQIAEAIALTCSQRTEVSSQWQIQALGKGWLNIFLQHEYLAKALRDLSLLPISEVNAGAERPEPRLQYVYARCCALLRLAIDYQDFSNDKGCMPQFKDCLEPVELILVLRNLAIADYLADYLKYGGNNVSHKSREKLRKNLLRSLATDFLSFYDQCRIFGVSHNIAYRRILIIETTRKMVLRLSAPEIAYAEYL